jgi:5'-methylthioadenosine phosphorylase
MAEAKVAIIGGSGFYRLEGMGAVREVAVHTPYGDTSDAITIGRLGDVDVAFLPRHGAGHRLLPAEVPAQANIWALKSLGVEYIISVSACGSLREDMAPLDLVVPDQIIDRTRVRPSSFFGAGIVAHVSFADPFCPSLSQLLVGCGTEAGSRMHRAGTLVVMEGPAFSTRAESLMYRSWGADLIGMTALPEAKLAREAEICYATLACITDYDVWHESEADVSADLIIANLLQNVEVSKRIVQRAVARLPGRDTCGCATALRTAIITPAERVPEQRRRDLAPIIGAYIPDAGAERAS